MPTYETIFIVVPNLTEEEEKTAVTGFAQVIVEGAVMVANERMGRRRLAYPIKKCEDGTYYRFLYDAGQALPKELERRLRISDKVLRHLTVRLEEDWAVAAKEQAVRDAQARAEAEAARAAAAAAEESAPEGEAAATGAAAPEKGDDDLEVVSDEAAGGSDTDTLPEDPSGMKE